MLGAIVVAVVAVVAGLGLFLVSGTSGGGVGHLVFNLPMLLPQAAVGQLGMAWPIPKLLMKQNEL
jgi:hypothetical protein